MNNDIFRKVQGLLAKAEGTDNENEANAFYAKAQELMLRHAIDEAAVRAAASTGRKPGEGVVFETFEYSSNDYNAKGKVQILDAAARANRCRVFLTSAPWGRVREDGTRINKTSKWATLVGFPGDVEYVKLLYTSLLVQASRMGAAEARSRGLTHRNGGYAFATAHMVGFAHTVRERFDEQARLNEAPVNALVVIEQDVDAAIRSRFGGTIRYQKSRGLKSGAGYYQGRTDGHRADIGNPGLSGERRALKA